jgi:glycosyltransferase involved in cell wall biosynthesis
MPTKNDVLFSIACITYNQENIVEECLESIFHQTYPLVELVICDDCSSDNTQEIIANWIKKREARFDNIVFLKNKENLGISASHDRALRQTRGRFIKYIAGDDILLKDGAAQITQFLSNTGTGWGQSLVTEFFPEKLNNLGFERPEVSSRKYFQLDSWTQFRMLCRSNFFCAPGNFFDRNVLEDIGFLDKSFRFFEDWHTWLRLTKAGFPMRLLPKSLVLWRRHKNSVSYNAMTIGNTGFYLDAKKTIEWYILPEYKKLDWLTRIRVDTTLKYLEELIKRGATLEAHKSARKEKLKDPLWWASLPLYLKSKLIKK